MSGVVDILFGYYQNQPLVALGTLVLTLLYYPLDIIAVSNLTSKLLLLTNQGVKKHYREILIVLALLLGAYLLIEIIGVLKDYQDTTNLPKFENYVRNQIIEPVFEKNLVNYDNVATANLIQNLQKIPKTLSEVFEKLNRYLIPFFIIVVTVTFYFFYLNSKLGMATLTSFLLYLLGFSIVAKDQLNASTKREKAENSFYDKIEDIINNLFTVTLANTGKEELANINQYSNDFNQVYHEEMAISSRGKFATGIAVVLLIGAICSTIIYLSLQGSMDQGTAVLAFGTVIFMSRHLRSLTRRVTETLIEVGTLLANNEVLLKTAQTTIKNGTRRDFLKGGAIRFDNVCFGYDANQDGDTVKSGQRANGSGKQILNNFNLYKPGGASLTIRGPSGSGKSTLVKLLNGYYLPQKGQVTLDGVDIKDVDRYYLRSVISYLPQVTRLFDRPIIENMLYGTNATPKQALETLDFLGVARIFKGVDLTRSAGRYGDKISGGQRQIVHLVRIYLTKPKIVILDEPTTGIDAKHQKYVQRAIQALSNKTSVVMITHEPDFTVGEEVKMGNLSIETALGSSVKER